MLDYEWGIDRWWNERQLIGQGAVRCGGHGTTPRAKRKNPPAKAVPTQEEQKPIHSEPASAPGIREPQHLNPGVVEIGVDDLRRVVGQGIAQLRQEGNRGPYWLCVPREIASHLGLSNGDRLSGVTVWISEIAIAPTLETFHAQATPRFDRP